MLFTPRFILRALHRCQCPRMSVNYCTSVGEKTTYKAAVCIDHNKPLIIQEKKKPTRLSKGQVLVAIEAAGINFSDILMCKGLYQVKPPLPFTAGSEICGYVEDIGESVSNVQKGDKVIGICPNYGGFAEYGVFHKSTLFKLPETLSTVQGAGTIISYGTAMMALGRRAQLQKGETVLITAAAGSTGLAAVDIASHVFDAKVIGLCGNENKCHLIKERGASYAIDYNTEDVRARIKEITEGKGVNVVMDQVGGDIFIQCLKSVAEEGRILTVGYASGTIPNIPANLLLLKSCTVMGVFWGNYSKTNPSAFNQSILDVTRAINRGDIYPHIGATFSLSKINAGFSYVENRKSTGKVVITTRDVVKSVL